MKEISKSLFDHAKSLIAGGRICIKGRRCQIDLAGTGENAVEHKPVSYVELTCSVKSCVVYHVEKINESQLDKLREN